MEPRNRRRQTISPCGCLRPLIRIWGIATAITICGVGVDITAHGFIIGIYLIICAVIIFLLETKWIITLFLQLSLSDNFQKSKSWSICWYAGGWRLAFPYVALGVAMLMWPHNLWLSYVAGSNLIFLALLRIFTIFRMSPNPKDHSLLQDDLSDGLENVIIQTTTVLEDEEALDPIDL